jgi:hypothetical protein
MKTRGSLLDRRGTGVTNILPSPTGGTSKSQRSRRGPINFDKRGTMTEGTGDGQAGITTLPAALLHVAAHRALRPAAGPPEYAYWRPPILTG